MSNQGEEDNSYQQDNQEQEDQQLDQGVEQNQEEEQQENYEQDSQNQEEIQERNLQSEQQDQEGYDQQQYQQEQDNNHKEQDQDQDDLQQDQQQDEEMEMNEVDVRSVYVQNVDYQSTKDDIIEHFKDVGEIHRVTILMDKFTGQPKGGAYIEFANSESVELAKGLSDSMLRGRQIKVVEKRTNIRGYNAKRGRGRGGIRRPAMGYHPMYMRGNYMFSYRGRGKGRGFRGPF